MKTQGVGAPLLGEIGGGGAPNLGDIGGGADSLGEIGAAGAPGLEGVKVLGSSTEAREGAEGGSRISLPPG